MSSRPISYRRNHRGSILLRNLECRSVIERAPRFPLMQVAPGTCSTADIGYKIERFGPESMEDVKKSADILDRISNVIRFKSRFESQIRELLSQSFR